jgi:hypothetical protein
VRLSSVGVVFVGKKVPIKAEVHDITMLIRKVIKGWEPNPRFCPGDNMG